MASRSHNGGHLDATANREVVYCHACSHEWYRDEGGLVCPACESDITEIVNPDNDPREPDHLSLAPSSPELPAVHYEDYSDPEEADIEEHIGPHGFIHRRSVRNGSEHATHHDPGVEPVLHRFYEMLQNFGQVRGLSNREPLSQDEDNPPPWPRIHRATFTSGTFGGGTASVTIFSGAPPGRQHTGQTRDGVSEDPFQAIFSDALRDLGPPQGDHQGGPPPNFARGLQDILSLFSPASVIAGDAVYSQEALDRIITQLMEANPQSNAAPPASEEALTTLDRKIIVSEMLRGESHTECTICIDELKIGDKAVTLPCKHCFHEECVVLWLKEHNTCPICRSPIETNSGNGHGGNGHGGNDTGGDGSSNTGASRPGPGSRGPLSAGFGGDASGSAQDPRGGRGGSLGEGISRAGGGSRSVLAGYAARPVTEAGSSRLDEALRAVSTVQQERDRLRGRRTPSQQVYDASPRIQRRTSISPASPRDTASERCGPRMRQRSPSENSRREQGDGWSGRQTSQGPIGWLRDRFTGSSGSRQGSYRDERRY